MEKKDNIQQTFRQDLFSGDTDKILKTIDSIRRLGSAQIIEPLFDLYATNKNEKVLKAIFSLVIDIKDQSNADVIIELLKKKKYDSKLKDFLSMCWQSNLDFSEYMEFLIDIILHKDLLTAFEAFTIIEENTKKLDETKNEKILNYLKNSIEKCPEENKELLASIITILNE